MATTTPDALPEDWLKLLCSLEARMKPARRADGRLFASKMWRAELREIGWMAARVGGLSSGLSVSQSCSRSCDKFRSKPLAAAFRVAVGMDTLSGRRAAYRQRDLIDKRRARGEQCDDNEASPLAHTSGLSGSKAVPVRFEHTLSFKIDTVHETQRVDALHRYQILDTPPEQSFDRITGIVAKVLAVPIALISFVDTDRIWFKSHHGLGVSAVPREPGFCDSCISRSGPWLITDAMRNADTAANYLVTHEPYARFYLGVPLRTADGFNLGTLCVLDTIPGRVSDGDVALLGELAGVTMDELELRLASRRALADHSGELIRREQVDEKNRSLTRELAHRSKNLLAVVLAIAQQTKLGHAGVDEYAGRLAARIRALAQTHDLLLAEAWEGVTLEELILRQTQSLSSNREKVQLTGPTIVLTPTAAQTLGMALHELAANCAQHGSCKEPDGRVVVRWTTKPTSDGPVLTLTWEEYGSRDHADGPPGFGRIVLERLTPQALNGHATWSNRASVNTWDLSCPLLNAGTAEN